MGNLYFCFDDLVQALQSALLEASESVKRRQTEIEEARFLRGRVYSFSIPGRGEGEYRTVEIPEHSLYSTTRPTISTLSLAVICWMKKNPAGGAELRILRLDTPPGEGRHNLEIVIRGTGTGEGEATVDGKSFLKIPPLSAGRADSAATTKGRWFDWLLSGGQTRCALSEEQAAAFITATTAP